MAIGDLTGHGDFTPRKVLIVCCDHEIGANGIGFKLSDLPRDGDRIRIMGRTYTFRSTLSIPSVANEIKIQATPGTCSLAFVEALRGERYIGTLYSVGTISNPHVVGRYSGNNLLGYEAHTTMLACANPGDAFEFDPFDLEDIITVIESGRLDTAQIFYDTSAKYLGGDYAAWKARGYTTSPGIPGYPPLAVATELMHGTRHIMEPVFLGVVDGVIHPYVVPADIPYGYYAEKKGSGYYVGSNPNGWDTWGGQGMGRRNLLAQAIIDSGYIEQWLPPGIKVDVNIEGHLDLLLVNTPYAFIPIMFAPEGRNYANKRTLPNSIVLNGRTITKYSLDGGGISDLSTTVHEYYHTAYSGGEKVPIFPGVPIIAGAVNSSWNLITGIPDVYLEGAPPGTVNPPYNNPCGECTHFSFKQVGVEPEWCKTLHPLMARSLGLAQLDRIITESGTYQIQAMTHSGDVLCIQSPRRWDHFMLLSVHYPQDLDGDTDYPYSGDDRKGVFATIYNPQNDGNNGYGYGNVTGIRTYMIGVCTEKYGYTDIDAAINHYYKADDVSKEHPLTYPKPVLIENGSLAVANMPIGIKVEFIRWLFPEGVPTAEVQVSIEPYPELPAAPTPVLGIVDDESAHISWAPSANHVYMYEWDTDPTFANANRAITSSASIKIGGLYPAATYYFRIRGALNESGSAYSDWCPPISFTTRGAAWHLMSADGALLAGYLDIPDGITRFEIVAQYESGTVVYKFNDLSKLNEIITVPVLYGGERLLLTPSYWIGKDKTEMFPAEIDTMPLDVTQISDSGRYPIPFDKQLRWVNDGGTVIVGFNLLTGMRTFLLKDGACIAHDPKDFITYKKTMATPVPTGECRVCFKNK